MHKEILSSIGSTARPAHVRREGRDYQSRDTRPHICNRWFCPCRRVPPPPSPGRVGRVCRSCWPSRGRPSSEQSLAMHVAIPPPAGVPIRWWAVPEWCVSWFGFSSLPTCPRVPGESRLTRAIEGTWRGSIFLPSLRWSTHQCHRTVDPASPPVHTSVSLANTT